MEIIKKETYRSQPYVNITDDMVRVTLSCTRNEWRKIKTLEAENARLERKKVELVEALEIIQYKVSWEINPSNYTHEQVCLMNADWAEIGSIVETTLKGGE